MKKSGFRISASQKQRIQHGLEVFVGGLLGFVVVAVVVGAFKATYDSGYRRGTVDMGLYCTKVIGKLRLR